MKSSERISKVGTKHTEVLTQTFSYIKAAVKVWPQLAFDSHKTTNTPTILNFGENCIVPLIHLWRRHVKKFIVLDLKLILYTWD